MTIFKRRSHKTLSFLINVDIWVNKDVLGYYGFCPLFKGFHTEGNTITEALNNAKNALAAYVLSLLKNHEPIPCCRILREEVEEESYYNENIEIECSSL